MSERFARSRFFSVDQDEGGSTWSMCLEGRQAGRTIIGEKERWKSNKCTDTAWKVSQETQVTPRKINLAREQAIQHPHSNLTTAMIRRPGHCPNVSVWVQLQDIHLLFEHRRSLSCRTNFYAARLEEANIATDAYQHESSTLLALLDARPFHKSEMWYWLSWSAKRLSVISEFQILWLSICWLISNFGEYAFHTIFKKVGFVWCIKTFLGDYGVPEDLYQESMPVPLLCRFWTWSG